MDVIPDAELVLTSTQGGTNTQMAQLLQAFVGKGPEKENPAARSLLSSGQMTLGRFVLACSLLAFSVSAGTYTTTFPNSESPLNQGGMWVNGSLTGGNKDCAVTNISGFHYAYGLQPGTNVPPVYDDSVAVLTGTWGPTQALDFTVYFTNQQPSTAGYWEELEYGLSCVLSNHWFSGYFMDLSLSSDYGYIELGLSYNGTNNVGLGGNVYGSQYVVTNGSTLHAGLTNKTISVFLNGQLVVRVTDTTGISIPNGAPGIGFYHQGDNGSRRTDFGMSRFSATDFSNNDPPGNQPPTLNPLANLVITQNAGLQTINMTGISSGATNELQTLTVTANSSDTGLIPNPSVSYTSPNSTGSLSFTPVASTSGVATISVTVNDGGASNNIITRSFTVTVDQPPNISGVGDQVIATNTTAGPLPFTVADAETPPANLVVAATSDNTALVPVGNIGLGGSGNDRTVTVTPVNGATGRANITLSVNDGVVSTSTTFQLTVRARPQPPRNVHVVGG